MFKPTQAQRDEARSRQQADMEAPVSTGLLSIIRPLARFLCRTGIFMIVWIVCCAIVDAWPQLSRPWVMLSGIVTYFIMDVLGKQVDR